MFAINNVKKIKPYTLSSHKAWQYKEDSEVLKLDWNEAVVLPSPMVQERLIEVIKNGRLNWYPDTNNSLLIDRLALYNDVKADNIQYFASSDSLHEYIVRSYISDADRVLIVGPTYDNFRAVAESNGAHIQFYNLDKNFELDYKNFNQDIKLIQPKVIYIVNPNNPTGTLHPKIELLKLLKGNPHILFIIDEAYYEFVGESMSEHVSSYNNLIISRTFSKAFALASFRIGYVISHIQNIKTLNSIRNPKNVSLFAQEAAIAALKDIKYTFKYVEEVKTAKLYFENELEQYSWLEPIKRYGNFTFIYISDRKMKSDLLEHFMFHKIFVRDYGHIEETKNYIRITIGTKENMEKVCSVIRDFHMRNENSDSQEEAINIIQDIF